MSTEHRLFTAELDKAADSRFLFFCALYHIVGYACQSLDKLGYRPLGVYHYIKGIHDLQSLYPDSTYLDYLVFFGIGACCFKVKADDLVSQLSAVDTCKNAFVIVDLIGLDTKNELEVGTALAYASCGVYSLGESLNTAVVGYCYRPVTPAIGLFHQL